MLKNVRNFIYDAKINRPKGIKDYEYEKQVTIEDGRNQSRSNLEDSQSNVIRKGCYCSQNQFDVLEREECGCSKKANGM